LIDHNPTRINEDYFEHVDYVINKAEEVGIYIGLLPTWGDKFNKAWGKGPEIFTPDNAVQFGKILAKRYKNQNNIIWILGGDRWPEDDEDREIIRSMAEGIRSVDKKHLITYHPSLKHLYIQPVLIKMIIILSETAEESLLYDLLSMANPDNHPDRFKPAEFDWLDNSYVRSSAYWTMLSGAAGYTYGAHGIWQMYQINRSPISNVRLSWEAALNLPGSKQVMIMKKLLKSFPWQQMKNDQSLILNDNPPNETQHSSGYW
jgi:hypothetical protein